MWKKSYIIHIFFKNNVLKLFLIASGFWHTCIIKLEDESDNVGLPMPLKVLLREIEDYRLTLESVNRLGQQLMMNNPRVPRLIQTLQAQLQNLEESYVNLQSTAHQIRVSRPKLFTGGFFLNFVIVCSLPSSTL